MYGHVKYHVKSVDQNQTKTKSTDFTCFSCCNLPEMVD